MVADGLHVGLAAWIGAQRAGDTFTTWPALPFGTRLLDVEAVQSMSDLTRAAELARMMNFTPRRGAYAEPFAGTPLWDVHRTVLSRMDFAVRPWSAEEDTQWSAARSVLYETGPGGRPQPSAAWQLYDELRIAYTALQEAGAPEVELTAAFADWVAIGSKQRIEVALATILRLAQRSSLPQAVQEQLALAPERLLATADGSYAPTSFAPLSALRLSSWLAAQTTLDELEQAIGKAAPRDRWTAWRAVRTGSVRFRYAALEVNRPWFTSTLYRADDWRLPAGATVSGGDGTTGDLPAVVSVVYLARVDDVLTDPKPPQPRPLPLPIGGLGRLPMPRAGVVNRPVAATPSARPPIPLAPATRAVGFTGRPLRLTDVNLRLAVARHWLARRDNVPGPSVPTTNDEIYVVGFGCTALPAAPRPSAAYQWT
jgi:hypothetical protein